MSENFQRSPARDAVLALLVEAPPDGTSIATWRRFGRNIGHRLDFSRHRSRTLRREAAASRQVLAGKSVEKARSFSLSTAARRQVGEGLTSA